jgi:cytochrome P450
MATIARIASQEPDELSDAALLGYALEGIRLSGAFGQYRQSTTTETISEDGGVQTPINAGDHVFVAFGAVAAKDPSRFPNPEAVDPRRPTDAYVHFGVGPHTWLGREVAHVALTELFRAVFGGMKGVRRVPERGLE